MSTQTDRAADVPARGAAEVLVTTPSFGQFSPEPWAAVADLGLSVRRPVRPHPLSAEHLAEEVGDADALVVGLDRVDAQVLAAGRRLRVVAKHGVGTDNIDVQAATARGITVVNAPGGNSDAVADLTVGLVLALARDILAAHRSVVAGRWERFSGPQLSGRTVGIVGFGRIGQAVARRFAGFGSRLLAHDPYVDPAVVAAAGAEPVGLPTLFRTADVVTLHLPGSPGGPVVDRDVLAGMPPGTLLVNAARGDLVDTAAVCAALEDGHLGGYAADAFSTEPPAGDDPLLRAPRTVLTPHIGAFTDAANAAMGVTVVQDVARVLGGLPPRHPVTT
ncbi:phosphoglycerate dehydrogenase [Kineococcus sp. SYSU DK003]|uniref:phosphoglycerate dehydrogenase n=1 Tax=Kineococcus sp. SYSU DK003 TaxID=3383124 RepID=UPI003D7DD3D4